MTLLNKVFPSILNADKINTDIPHWPDLESPWNILSNNNEHNILNQIVELINSKSGKTQKQIGIKNVIIDESIGPVFIHPTASISAFVKIEGPTYIGKNAEIRHSAYLRKGCWISEGVIVGHATEIKNSVLLPYSKAPHFNYVGDSILGERVNLGAGTKISNVRNDTKEIRIYHKNGNYSDTGMKKFGALIGDKSQLGCNVVSNPGTIIMPNSLIPPNVNLSGWNEY
jgi:UDP-N-acetylglucosamine diphosphorylase / glucose-1-phosphate thymidylyltransferase / UDP-N-acetylgalactosamine diphosphorylase / glucosamine-1-phosphate N-acetyltransferase / galactosamine-1-phosphate N-acetyltransferase